MKGSQPSERPPGRRRRRPQKTQKGSGDGLGRRRIKKRVKRRGTSFFFKRPSKLFPFFLRSTGFAARKAEERRTMLLLSRKALSSNSRLPRPAKNPSPSSVLLLGPEELEVAWLGPFFFITGANGAETTYTRKRREWEKISGQGMKNVMAPSKKIPSSYRK